MPVYTIDYTVYWRPVTTWINITASVLSVVGSNTLSSSTKNPLAFGDAGEVSFTVNVLRSLGLSTWSYVPIRVVFTRNVTNSYNHWGAIVEQDGNLDAVALACKGVAALINKRTRTAYSPAYYRRPPFTRTTVTSIENPTNIAYQAGLGNYLAWQAGGRPLAQAATYPNADFYYDFEQAIVAPDWTWAAGEGGWEEMKKLAQATGGQLYQACGGTTSATQDGILMYTHPLSTANGTATYTFTASVYGDIQEQISAEDLIDKAVVPYKRRARRPTQEVVNDGTPRQIPAGESLTITLEPKLPLVSLQYATGSTTQLAASCIQATFQDGTPVTQSNYTHTVDFAAAHIVLTITNTAASPINISRIILQGDPLAAGEPGSITVGSGDTALTHSDNDYIQSESHANRLAMLDVAIYGVERPIRKLVDCPYDPERFVGETVGLTCSELSLTAEPHLIVGKQDDDTGAVSGYDLISLAGLPYSDQYFVVSTSAQSGTKKLGF